MLVKVKKLIQEFERTVYFIGLWPNENSSIYFKMYGIFVFCAFYLPYVIAAAIGAVVTKIFAERIFLVMCTTSGSCLILKIIHFYRKREDIRKVLDEMNDYTIHDQMQYDQINGKIEKFSKFKSFVFRVVYGVVGLQLVVPLILQEKVLLIKIWVPIDWSHSNAAYWIINVYSVICIALYAVAIEFSVIVWYLMLNFALKYEMLGCQLMNLGNNGGCSSRFKTDLINCIESHLQINL